jgi:hypothetical protein
LLTFLPSPMRSTCSHIKFSLIRSATCIWRQVRIMNLLTAQYPPFFFYFTPLRSRYSS